MRLFRSSESPANSKVLLVGGAIVTVVVLQLYRISAISLWSDEFSTIRLIRLPIEQLVLGEYSGELNPPLYHILLSVVVYLFGESEVVMRLFSMTFSSGALVLCYFLAAEMFPRLSAWLPVGAVLLLGFHPRFIRFATEIRSYSLLLFFAVLSLYSYFRLMREERAWTMWHGLFLVSLVACPYIHHFGALVLAAVLIFAAVRFVFGCHRRQQLRAVLLVGASGVLYLPGLNHFFLQQAAEYPDAILVPPAEYLQVFLYSLHAPIYEPLLFVVALASFFAGLILLVRDERSRATGVGLLLVLGAVVYATLVAYAAGIGLLPRYLHHLLPLALIPIAAPLGIGGKRLGGRLVQGVALVAIVLYGIYGVDFALRSAEESSLANWKADWRTVAGAIRSMDSSAHPVVLTAWDNSPVEYYVDNPVLTLREFQEELERAPRTRYLIVTSENSAQLPILRETEVLYSDADEGTELREFSP